jgi:hypothetical protein
MIACDSLYLLGESMNDSQSTQLLGEPTRMVDHETMVTKEQRVVQLFLIVRRHTMLLINSVVALVTDTTRL